MKKLLLLISIIILSITNVYASCSDNELNEWAVNVKPKYILSKDVEDGKYDFSYFIVLDNPRDDIVIKAIDGEDWDYGSKYGSIYGVGCFTNLEELTYKVEIYGAEDSKCPNELLKSTTLTVPRYNRLMKDRVCEENPDHELCQPFTNKTKDMTSEELKQKVKVKEESKPITLKTILNYALYLIIPFIIISVIYIIRKNKFKKKEGNK